MTHPANTVANCQILNKISTYTKCEREFMNHTMNSLSLSDSALVKRVSTVRHLSVLQALERMWSDAG